MPETAEREWWRGAVIYQIYPRSFADSNGDGIGDLAGITEKLPYLEQLGVDAIWISPFFTSPMRDFGYDIADYRSVDPIFGALDDFKTMLADAHARGIKIIIDQVYSHSSDDHAWFAESRQDRTNPKADWYVWADAKDDGTPPNNWLSIFGGPAWQWDSRRQQYYLHNFLVSQPDLNLHNPEVQEAILDVARFWLDLGVDGFRLDVVNFFFHDAELRDNPPVLTPEQQFVGADPNNPFSKQYHARQLTQPENLPFLERLRGVMDSYPDRFTVGEIGGPEGLKIMAAYTADENKLHSAYTFELLSESHSATYLRDTLERVEANLGDGWPCFSLSNHDVVRSVSRWGVGADGAPLDRAPFAKASLAFLLSLRGSVCIYQGEELGLPEADVAFEHIQDPFGIEFWPDFKGRDGCRTPIAWSAEGGFSSGTADPWLPIEPAHLPLNAEAQDVDPESVLSFAREFLAWRKQQPALISGDFRWHDLDPEVICFERTTDGQAVLVLVNLTGAAHDVTLPSDLVDRAAGVIRTIGTQEPLAGPIVALPPVGAAFLSLSTTS